MVDIKDVSSKELSLVDIMILLMKNKIQVGLIILLFIIMSVLYALIKSDVWTSRTSFSVPKFSQVSTYLSTEMKLRNILNNEKFINPGDLVNQTFKGLEVAFSSRDIQESFFKNSTYYQKITQGLDSLQKEAALLKLLDGLKIEIDKYLLGDLVKISLSADSGENAQNLLKDYVKFVENKYKKDLGFEINTRVNLAEDTFTLIVDQEKNKAISDRKNRILTLDRAINSAKLANVDANQKNNKFLLSIDENNRTNVGDNNNIFLLGQKNLQSQLNVIQKAPIIYSDDYYKTIILQQQLSELSDFNFVKSNDQMLDYVQQPTLPLIKDSPKKVLIILLGAILGFLTSIGLILGRYVIEQSCLKQK